MENLILGRRSVRRYLDRPVERELVETDPGTGKPWPQPPATGKAPKYHVITDRKKIAEITSMTAADMSKIAKMMNGSFGRVMARLVMGKEMFPSVLEVQPMVRYIVGEHKEGRDTVLYNAPGRGDLSRRSNGDHGP